MNKNSFEFKWFNDLKTGNKFKFSPIIDSDVPSKFFTVIKKNDTHTKFAETYGKMGNVREFANDTPREVMIFTNR